MELQDVILAQLIDLPAGVAVAGVVALGWPERPLHRRLTRRPAEDVVYSERYGVRLFPGPAG